MKKPAGPASPHDTATKTIELENLSFNSYVALCVLISVCIGLVVSMAFFVLGTSFHWGGVSIADTWTGIVALYVGPSIFGVVGFIGSRFTHQQFLWALRKHSGLSLTGSWTKTDLGRDLKIDTQRAEPRRPAKRKVRD